MSRDWTPEEIQAASQLMKAAGHMSFEEFCEELDRGGFALTENKEEKTMEDIFVYDTGKKPEEVIEGLADIRAAYKRSYEYHRAKALFERGELVDMPAYRPGEIQELEKKYPRAAAYREADRWVWSENPIKKRLGTQAVVKLLNGEDPEAVIQEMSRGLDAFYIAQQGD